MDVVDESGLIKLPNDGTRRVRDLNEKPHDIDSDASIYRLAFINGNVKPSVGDVLSQASGAKGIVFDVETTSGTWSEGTAEGNIWFVSIIGNWVVCVIDSADTKGIATSTGPIDESQIRLRAGAWKFQLGKGENER